MTKVEWLFFAFLGLQMASSESDDLVAKEIEQLDLNDLRIYTYVAVLCSFSAAAMELGISKSSVSRSIVRLEKFLGNALLQRTTRKVKLTRAGAVLRDRGSEVLQRINDSIAYVGKLHTQPTGPLTVRVHPDSMLGEVIHSAVLPKLLSRYEEISIDLRSVTSRALLLARDVDVAFYPGPTPAPGASRLASIPKLFVASAEAANALSTDQFSLTPFLVNTVNDHPFHQDVEGTAPLEFNKRIRLNDSDDLGLRELAMAGVGVACFPRHFCSAQLRSGALVQVLQTAEVDPLQLYVNFPSQKNLAPAVAAFVGLLRSALRDYLAEESSVPDERLSEPNPIVSG